MPRLILATSAAYPDLTPADQLYRAALERRGADVEVGVWSDGDARFRDADLVVIRSTWDYHRDLARYRVWLASLEQAGTAVVNPVELVRWNLEKTYLDELAAAGIPVPAQRVVPCDRETARRALAEAGWRQAVAKPSVGASGHGVSLVTAASLDTAWDQLATAVSPHRLVLQEYVSEIQAEGQISYVFLGGRFVHAVRFLPRDGEFRINSKFEPHREVIAPPDSDIEEAARVIKALPISPLHARIDMVRRDGRQLLLEAEVNEPGLLFQYAPTAADIFAIETLDWLNRYSGASN